MRSDSIGLPRLKKLRPEDRLLFLCTRQQFLPEHRESLLQLLSSSRLPWDLLYTTAVRHGVGPLVCANLLQCSALELHIADSIRARFNSCIRKNKVLKGLFADRAHQVLDFFAKRSLPVMLIKGAVLDALVYEHPWCVHTGDIDLVIGSPRSSLPPQDRSALNDIVRGHLLLNRLVPLEVEWQAHHDVSMNDLLPIDFDAVWARALPLEIYGSRAWVMCREDLLLTACINACRKRYFRLKALCDIAELMRVYEFDWKVLVERAKEWQCNWIVYTALLTTAMTLGSTLPLEVLSDLDVPSARRRLIHFLSSRMSFTTLGTLSLGSAFLGRKVGAGLLLPNSTLRGKQLFKNLRSLVWT